MKIILSEKQLALFNKNLLNEQTSSQVKEVQQKLNDCCKSGLSVDGIVGPATARAIKSCLGIDITNSSPNPTPNPTTSEGVQCLKDAGFEWQSPHKIGNFTIPGYYSKEYLKLNGTTYRDAQAIETNNQKGYNFRESITPEGTSNVRGYVRYGNWSCKNGKLDISMSKTPVMKTPGEYGF
jgi:peptidoglycan hydrolase-like protein with peptidoglycan-binding domain